MYNVVDWTPGTIAIVRYEGVKRIMVRVMPATTRNLDAARGWCGKRNARLLAERKRADMLSLSERKRGDDHGA